MDWQAWLTISIIIGIAVALVRDLARPDVIFLTALGLSSGGWNYHSNRSLCRIFQWSGDCAGIFIRGSCGN